MLHHLFLPVSHPGTEVHQIRDLVRTAFLCFLLIASSRPPSALYSATTPVPAASSPNVDRRGVHDSFAMLVISHMACERPIFILRPISQHGIVQLAFSGFMHNMCTSMACSCPFTWTLSKAANGNHKLGLSRLTSYSHRWSMGSMLFLASWAVLLGPITYAQHLVSGPRLPFTAVYFGSIALTLYFSIGVSPFPMLVTTCRAFPT